MLSSIRKFSTSIYAKILLGIIVIPFVFWGMGSSFTGGSKNIVVVIDKEKHSIQEFVDFIRKFSPPDEKINVDKIDELLSIFIGEKIIEKEVESFGIKLSDSSLGSLIKNQKDFKRENKFSRTEYEKFLLKNNITAVSFEFNLSKHEKKKQFLDFIAGGISPPKFLVNASFDQTNQKRDIELINLNNFFKREFNFSEDQIKSYYERNKDKYKEIYKSVEIIELNPKRLIGSDEFNDLFFKKIDQIDDMIIEGKDFDFVTKKFNLEKTKTFTFNILGKNINSNKTNELPMNLIKNIFSITNTESTALIENENKYFIVKLVKTESIEISLKNENVKKEILLNLETKVKRKLISKIIHQIKQNNFPKSEFDKLSNDKNLPIEKISLENQNDEKRLKKEIVNKIYSAPKKKVIIVHDLGLTENFLIYVSKIENVSIDKKSNEYKKYSNLSKKKITNELLSTYDEYIKKKYKIDINYKALETVKNYFN